MEREFRYQLEDVVHTVTVTAVGDSFTVRVGEHTFEMRARPGEDGRLDLEVDGRRLRAYVARQGPKHFVAVDGATWTLARPDPRRRARADGAGGSLTAAMPGRVLDVLVRPGDQVQKGDTLVLLEAMKMELRIHAPAAGTVHQVHVAAGQVVERGARLVEIS